MELLLQDAEAAGDGPAFKRSAVQQTTQGFAREGQGEPDFRKRSLTSAVV
jgi:hypothetical protein